MIQQVKWMKVRNYEALKEEEKKTSFVQQNCFAGFYTGAKCEKVFFEVWEIKDTCITDTGIHITYSGNPFTKSHLEKVQTGS